MWRPRDSGICIPGSRDPAGADGYAHVLAVDRGGHVPLVQHRENGRYRAPSEAHPVHGLSGRGHRSGGLVLLAGAGRPKTKAAYPWYPTGTRTPTMQRPQPPPGV